MNKPTIGVYIDADNISIPHVREALTSLEEDGNIIAIKAFGNAASRPDLWKDITHQYGLIFKHSFKLTLQKNASDISLVVDAVKDIYTQEATFTHIAILSSDSDFQPLVLEAKSAGIQTICFGRDITPKSYQNSCHTFHKLSNRKSHTTASRR